jgi:asparagine synthase (glutamine-hydrolysing)
MCGIAGFLSKGLKDLSQRDSEKILLQMGQNISSRGPDDCGAWLDLDVGVGLSHRRLSVVELSVAGHQPMLSPSSRYAIVFNGEIYNHNRIRDEINQTKGSVAWIGQSDTETLLAGFDTWGIDKTIEKCIGMFAFAVWDASEQLLTLARDRLGEKPLYYWHDVSRKNIFLFASELKALKAHPAFPAKVNRNSLSLFMRHGYIPAPYSIYEDVFKLEPGCILRISSLDHEPVLTKYWDLIATARNGKKNPFKGSPIEAVDALELLAKDAVRQQMIADVSLGAFLSGGVDSSTVVSLMQAQSTKAIKTFTIGFEEKEFNEAVHAKAVAQYLGTEHTELYVTPTQAMEVIPKLPSLYCEPFADSSQIPTFLVSQLAKQHVTVSLSGDAGDELFCGYNRYKLTEKLWGNISLAPAPVRELFSKCITSIAPTTWDKLGRLLPGLSNYPFLGDKMHKGAKVLASRSMVQLYLGMVSQTVNPTHWVINGREPPTKLIGNSPSLMEFGGVEQMMLLDALSYLPDDILVKLDRATMGVSLEARAPFLDHRIVEFAETLPLEYKLHDSQTKWPLRQLLYKYVPKELIDRPKMGFGVPIGDWLRGPLREWAEELLSEARLIREGFFYPHIIRSKWAEHLSGSRNWQSQIWTVLMFQAWLENER